MEISSALPTESPDWSLLSKSPGNSLPFTPTRGEGQPWNSPETSVNYTPDCSSSAANPPPISMSSVGASKQKPGNYTQFSQTPEVASSCIPNASGQPPNAQTKAKGRQKGPKGQPRTCRENRPPAKRQHRKEQEMEGSDANSQPPQRCRLMFELQELNSQEKESSDPLLCSSSLLSKIPESFLATTPRRGERQPWDTPEVSVNSTPDCRSLAAIPSPTSVSPVGAKEELGDNGHLSQTLEVDPSCSIPKARGPPLNPQTKAKGRQKCPKGQRRTCRESRTPAKCRRKKEQEMEGSGANSPPQCRPIFGSAAQEFDSPEKESSQSLLSSSSLLWTTDGQPWNTPEAYVNSTPDCRSFASVGCQTPEVDSSLSIQRLTSGLRNTTTKAKRIQKCPKGQPQTCTEKKPPAKRQRRKDQEMEESSDHLIRSSSLLSKSPESFLPTTPKRGEGQPWDTPEASVNSTPDCGSLASIPTPISLSPVGAKEETPEVDSSLSIQRSTSALRNTTTKAKGRQKCPKGQPQTCTEKKTPAKRRRRKDQEMEESSDQLIRSSSLLSESPDRFLPTTPMRGEGQPWDTAEAAVNSTPVCGSLASIPTPISLSPVGAKEQAIGNNRPFRQTPEVDSSLSVQRSTSALRNTTTKAKGRQKNPKGQPQTCIEKKLPAKRRRRKDQEIEESSDQLIHSRSLLSESPDSFLPTTPTRGEGQPWDTAEAAVNSTPDCRSLAAIPSPISLSPVGAKEQTPEVDSSLSIQRSTSGLRNTSTKAKGRQKNPKGQPQTCTEKEPPAKRRRRKDQEMEESSDQLIRSSSLLSESPDSFLPTTPTRREGQPWDTPEASVNSTPDCRSLAAIPTPISLSPVGAKEQTPEVDSSLSIQQSTSALRNTTTKAKGRQKCPKGQPRTCTKKKLPAKRQRRKEVDHDLEDLFDFLTEISIPPPIPLPHVGANEQTPEVDSSCIIPKANGRSSNAQSKAKGRQKCPEGQPRTSTEKRPPAKPRRRKVQEISIPPPISLSHVGVNEQTPAVDSSCIIPKANGRSSNAQSKAKGRQKCPKGKPRTSTEKRPPAKPRRRKDQEISIPPPISLSHVGANEQGRQKLPKGKPRTSTEKRPPAKHRRRKDQEISIPPPISLSNVGAHDQVQGNDGPFSQTPEVDSSCIIPKANRQPLTAQSKAKGRQKCPKGKPGTSTEKRPPAKPRRRKDQEISIPPPISLSNVGTNEQTLEVDSSCIIPKANRRPLTAQSKAKGRQKCPKGKPRTSTEKRPPAKPRRRKDQEISIPPSISLSNEQTPEVDSSCIPEANARPPNAQSKAKGRQKCPKGQLRTSTEKRPQAKPRHRKDQEKKGSDANSQCGRPIFESQDMDSSEKDISDFLLEISSTLPTESSDQPLISVSPVGAKEQELGNDTLFSQTPDLETCSTPEARSRPLTSRSKAKRRQKSPKAQPQTCSENNRPPAKRRRSRKGQELEDRDTNSQTPQRCRPRFELQEVESPEKGVVNLHIDESSLSSDLSIELSDYEEQLASFCTLDEEEEEEEEELPSLLMQKKPPSITVGVFVWCKFRTFPFWPAVVKSMNRRMKKASVVFIDGPVMDKICKGLTVSLKTMKPFDCEESSQFVCQAKEKYDAAIKWSLDMISDYRMRIACEHFTGSFIEYINHDMSYPVRRTFLQDSGETPTISGDLMKMEEFQDHEGKSAEEEQEEVKRQSKRRLPDRTFAAYNRANEKLVYYIVNRRMVEKRLLAVISGQQRSTWLHSFLNITQNRKRPVPTYLLEDHVEKVLRYLKEVFDAAPVIAPCLANVNCVNFLERIRFVLDVLLPEAVIYALAGVHNVSIATAEEKFLRGRQISNREREEFEWLIEQEMKRRSRHQNSEVTGTIID